MKPIETTYNGYRFRSRLEARWAVFFDMLGWKYLYEPEGFDLNGVWYLPDFYLPEEDTWFEVKLSKKLTEAEREKITRFIETGSHYMLLIGDPSEDMTVIVDGGDHIHEVIIFDCACCGGLAVCDKPVSEKTKSVIFSRKWRRAILAARSARFEHGESGAPIKASKVNLDWSEYHGYYISEAGTVMAEGFDSWMAIPEGSSASIGSYSTVEEAEEALERYQRVGI